MPLLSSLEIDHDNSLRNYNRRYQGWNTVLTRPITDDLATAPSGPVLMKYNNSI